MRLYKLVGKFWGIGIALLLHGRPADNGSIAKANGVVYARRGITTHFVSYKRRDERTLAARSKRAKTVEKAVIVRQRNSTFTRGKQLNGLPDDFGNPGDFIVRGCLGNQGQEAVGGMAVAQEVGKAFLPFGFIRSYNRFIFTDRIID